MFSPSCSGWAPPSVPSGRIRISRPRGMHGGSDPGRTRHEHGSGRPSGGGGRGVRRTRDARAASAAEREPDLHGLAAGGAGHLGVGRRVRHHGGRRRRHRAGCGQVSGPACRAPERRRRRRGRCRAAVGGARRGQPRARRGARQRVGRELERDGVRHPRRVVPRDAAARLGTGRRGRAQLTRDSRRGRSGRQHRAGGLDRPARAQPGPSPTGAGVGARPADGADATGAAGFTSSLPQPRQNL